MAQIFERITGKENVLPFTGKSGSAISIGDLVTLDDDSYDIFAAATDKLVFGIARSALGASSTAQINVDVLKPYDVVRAKVATGTAAASEIGHFQDIGSSTTGITTTESNNDAICVGFTKPGYLDVMFTTLIGILPTATVSD